MIYLFIFLTILCFGNAGFTRAIFEAILFYDTVKLYFKNAANYYFFTRELFTSNKDRNKDGTISYWENAFPFDGGHWAKHGETFFLFFGVLFSVFAFLELYLKYELVAFVIYVFILVFCFIFRAGVFEFVLTKLRKKK